MTSEQDEFKIETVSRKKTKIRIGLSGVSGSGKTMSALYLAFGITGNWNKIVIIDTENESSRAYAHLGPFQLLSIKPPFHPDKFTRAIRKCEELGFEVIIVDSITAAWDGEGGTLRVAEAAGKQYPDYKVIMPQYEIFINAILFSSTHMICTVKQKAEYVVYNEQSGKPRVTKMGTKPIAREGFEYNLTVNFDIDIEHNAKASKDRTSLFIDKGEMKLSQQQGQQMKKWCESGEDEWDMLLSKCKSTWDIINLYIKERPIIDRSPEVILKFAKWNDHNAGLWREHLKEFVKVNDLIQFAQTYQIIFSKASEVQEEFRKRKNQILAKENPNATLEPPSMFVGDPVVAKPSTNGNGSPKETFEARDLEEVITGMRKKKTKASLDEAYEVALEKVDDAQVQALKKEYTALRKKLKK